jgi:hypothetical protein
MVMLICGNGKDHWDVDGCIAKCMQHMNTMATHKIGPRLRTSETTMMINGLLLGCYGIAWMITNH